MKNRIAFILCLLIFACNEKKEGNITPPIEPIIEEVIKPQNFSYEEIAKYTMSLLMNQSPSIMDARKDGDLYIVSYVRKSDKQRFTYKVKFNSNTIVWANIDGRWRDGVYDEKLEFEEKGNALLIHNVYSDGSKETKEFKK